MIMVPTINIFNQLIIALPIIIMYQISIVLIWRKASKTSRPAWVKDLLEQDRIIQSERLESEEARTPII